MILSNLAIRNRTSVFVLMIIIIVVGSFSYATLPRESFPDITMPKIVIMTANAGVAPADIESTITNEIEQKLTGLKGMDEITSISAEGLSMITVEFESGVDIDVALQRVKDKVDLARPELPQDADEPVEPVVSEISFSDIPIMVLSMSGDLSPVRMKTIAEDLEEEIESLPGVLEVDVLGALEREIVLEVDPDRLTEYNLTLTELLRLIPSENVNQTAGGLETPGMSFNIRIPAEFVQPDEIDKLPVARRGDRIIYLSDVATVRDSFKDRASFSRLDGQPSITLNIKKRVGSNIVDIADMVKALLDKARPMLPAGLRLELITDQSDKIAMMVLDLENNILTGLVLVVAVLLLFMGLRTSLIVAIAIPLSMLISFAVLTAIGITLNMVVLFSLILALGMLVDNAIVIVENIYRYMELGYPRIQAAMEGAAEVAWPIVASTATTVAAFFPLIFWPDLMGEFMSYLPKTVIIVLCSSLFVALIINPVVCSIVAKPRKHKAVRRESRFLAGYRKLLIIALHKPGTTLILAICILAVVATVYDKRKVGVELFPEEDPEEAIVSIRAAQGTNIYETDRIARIIEARLEPFRTNPEQGYTQIDHVVTNVGSPSGGPTPFGATSGSNTATITIVFPDYEERIKPDGEPWYSENLIREMRKAIDDIPGAEITLEKREGGPPTGAPVTVRFIGKDLDVLKQLSDKARKLIQPVDGLVNLQSDLEDAKPELVFVPDRKRAGLLGVNTATISNFLKTSIFGTKVGDFREFNDEYDIRLRLPITRRSRIDEILELRVPTEAGQAVPLSSLGRFEYRPGLGTIHRLDRKRVVTLTADAEGRLGPEVLADAQKQLEQLALPPGYRIEYAGEQEEQERSQAFLLQSFAIALLLIVAILVAQFNTLSAPVIIMTTVILSMIGVLIGLLMFSMPFGIIMTGVGVISLAGVVVNNAIVLLDYTRQLQQRGRSLLDAAIEAGVTRLRPVMLTATTTILGLIPMATGISFDFHIFAWDMRSSSSQWWSSMAIAVIFGLGFATLLTLLVVPSLYVMLYRLASRFGLGGLDKPTDPEHDNPAPVLEDY
jgi:multidrug efflux pump